MCIPRDMTNGIRLDIQVTRLTILYIVTLTKLKTQTNRNIWVQHITTTHQFESSGTRWKFWIEFPTAHGL